MNLRFIMLLLVSTYLFSCADLALKSKASFKLGERDYLYQKIAWSFVGRLVITDSQQSLSALINWKHDPHRDLIELAGMFGQGRTRIELSKGKMVVDNGDERLQYLGLENELVSTLLGVNTPISALKFWVRGLVLPAQDYTPIDTGFLQSGWRIKYPQMQFIGRDKLPRKIKMTSDNATLKLIINQWQ